MWEIKTPSGVRVPHRASACVTDTPFSPQWFCGSPIPYSCHSIHFCQSQGSQVANLILYSDKTAKKHNKYKTEK